jgi:hypothetical protein
VRQNAVHFHILQRIAFYRFIIFRYQHCAMQFYKLISAIHGYQQRVAVARSYGYVYDGPSA